MAHTMMVCTSLSLYREVYQIEIIVAVPILLCAVVYYRYK